MNIRLGKNDYGKRAINLSKIIRHEAWHEIRQISVSIALQGDFENVHTRGDNTKVLPTDTMKNTVYALARASFSGSIEDFAIVLAKHFLKGNPQLTEVKVEIDEYSWRRLAFNGEPHPNSFVNGGSEKHYTLVTDGASGLSVVSGVRDLLILKTTDSAFKGYIHDQFTTLRETDDRILSTQCEATWLYSNVSGDYTKLYPAIRDCLLKTFAFHKSLSVQHTLYAMGEAVLNEFPDLTQISLKMPNKHHILYNLEQFGMENNNEVFIATDEPYGYITGTVMRAQ